MAMTESVFLLAFVIAATTAVLVARAIASGLIGRRGAPPAEISELKEQMEQQAAALEDAENRMADQSAQLAELQERLDFAERILARDRDRPSLEAGDERR
jgi:uncharacterized protein YycO